MIAAAIGARAFAGALGRDAERVDGDVARELRAIRLQNRAMQAVLRMPLATLSMLLRPFPPVVARWIGARFLR